VLPGRGEIAVVDGIGDVSPGGVVDAVVLAAAVAATAAAATVAESGAGTVAQP
jgi:hypothetical protein